VRTWKFAKTREGARESAHGPVHHALTAIAGFVPFVHE
jgi:hypothetical protein